MEGSGALIKYIYGGGMFDPRSGDIYMSVTYFSQVVLVYNIAPRRRFTYLSRNLYFSCPPFQVRYWNFLILFLVGLHVHSLKCLDSTLSYYHEKNAINL